MKYISRFVVLALMCASLTPCIAQRSPFDNTQHRLFSEGQSFFTEKNYSASTRYLEEYLKTNPDAESEELRQAKYYIAMSSYILRKDDAQSKLEAYQARYPYSTDNERIHLYLGILEFESGKYKPAIKHFEQIKAAELDEEEFLELLFYKGYAYVKQESYEKAAYELQELLKKPENKFSQAARYYYGFSQYRLENYETAYEYLKSVEDHPDFQTTTPYIICQCLYKMDRCSELQSYGKALLDKGGNNKNINDIKHLLGACSFKSQNYADALEYLSLYKTATKKISREDWYMLGISAYKTDDFKNAIAYLSKATSKEDILTQNSYFHIAMAYIKLGDKKNARMAFEAAARYKYDSGIQEDALYNYALVTYEMSFSPFNESVVAFERFLKYFPNSQYVPKVYEYLLNVYLTTKNYDAAYQSIQNIKSDNPAIKEAEQRVLFGMGTTAVANRKYGAAAKNFETIINNRSYNYEITARSYFWYGECMYKMKKYDEAKKAYEGYLNKIGSKNGDEYSLAHYNLGYVYIKQNDYKEANLWFRKFINLESEDKVMLVDACNRIGDCYFQNRQFDQAKNAYEQASQYGIKIQGTDYSLYQKGFVCGLQKDYNQKITIMQSLIAEYPKSDWADDALFEIGRAYVAIDNNADAITTFNRINKEYPKTNSIVRKSKLQIAMLQYNGGETDKAVSTYKSIISEYPNTEEAETSLSTLESILVETNRVEEYTGLTKSLGRGSSTQADSLMYKAAEKVYFRDELEEAINSFTKYINTYPEGKYNALAKYYMANCYYRQNDKSTALSLYISLIDNPKNPNLEETLVRTAAISYDENKHEEAYKYFSQLYELGSKDNKKAASIGMMRCAYMINNYQETIDAANRIAEQYGTDAELMLEVVYKRMKSYINTDRRSDAAKDITTLAKDTRNEYGAEAKYLMAETYKINSQNDEAEKEIFDFIDKGTPHTYWLAKSFILLSDIYIEQENYFEAKQYLLSLQDNYKEADEDIKKAIAERLEIIEKHENETVSNN